MQALSISEQTLVPSHPELALAYFNMGGLEYQRSNFALAESYCQRALEIQLKTLAETDPRVITTLEAGDERIRKLAGTSIAVSHSEHDFATSRLCVTRLRLEMLEN